MMADKFGEAFWNEIDRQYPQSKRQERRNRKLRVVVPIKIYFSNIIFKK